MGCGCSSTKSAQAEPAQNAPTREPAQKQEPAQKEAPVKFSRDANLSELLGATLLSSSGSVDTAEFLAGRAAVALYFSAHWCPPCRNFTPQLADWYKTSLKNKGLEVVFVSSDKDASSFSAYYKDMPWLALPFADRGRKEALSKRFKVQGIPTLVILGSDGKVITKDGRAAVSGDPTGAQIPWRPKSLQETLLGAKLLGQDGAEYSTDILKDKCVAFYFSAHWCPPCRVFTPKLADWYVQNLKNKGLEVVFVSSDRDDASFKEYFGTMPWLALDYSDRARKEQLNRMFDVSGIPALVITGSDGQLITKDGRAAVSNDPEGKSFPWHPKPVSNLKAGPGSLQVVPTVIAFCEGCTPEVQQATIDAMTPLAERYKQEQKASGESDPACAFAVATEAGGIAARLREIMFLPLDAQVPRLMIIDIPEDGAFYAGKEGPVTADSVAKLMADYESGALEKQQLKN